MLNRFSFRIPNISLQRLFSRTSSLNFSTSRLLRATQKQQQENKQGPEGGTGLSVTELEDGTLQLPDRKSTQKLGQEIFPEPPPEMQRLKVTLTRDEGRDIALGLFSNAARIQDLNGADTELNTFYQKNEENEELEFLLSRVDVEDATKLKTIREKELDWSGIIGPSGVSDHTSKYLVPLIDTLQKENRLTDLFTIIESFNKLMADWKGESAAVITTPSPLSSASLEFFKKSISSQFGDESIKSVINAVDPSLGLGYVLQIGDTYRMDMSWRARREQMIASLPTDGSRAAPSRDRTWDEAADLKKALPEGISPQWIEDLLKGKI